MCVHALQKSDMKKNILGLLNFLIDYLFISRKQCLQIKILIHDLLHHLNILLNVKNVSGNCLQI